MKGKNNLRENFIWNPIGISCYSFSSLFPLIIVTRTNGVDEDEKFTYAFFFQQYLYIALFYNREYQILKLHR